MELSRERYDSIIYNIIKVYEIFQDYFGEERVDLQGILDFDNTCERLKSTPSLSDASLESIIIPGTACIIIFFPEVTITNEHDKSVNIKELWAKVNILPSGKLRSGFTLNRSNYSMVHLRSDYMHSHIQGINWRDPSQFLSPCLGEGPIRRTISNLCTQLDFDIWRLFCYELDLYVHTESLSGGPWRHLESIGVSSRRDNAAISDARYPNYLPQNYSCSLPPIIKDFIKYFLEKKVLKFCYVRNAYYLGMSFLNFRILLSNSFIEWINRQDNPYRLPYATFKTYGILNKYIIKNNIIYRVPDISIGQFDSIEELEEHFIGKRVLTFKGKEIVVSVDSDESTENLNTSILITYEVCNIILSLILRTVNFNYGNHFESIANTGSGGKTEFI